MEREKTARRRLRMQRSERNGFEDETRWEKSAGKNVQALWRRPREIFPHIVDEDALVKFVTVLHLNKTELNRMLHGISICGQLRNCAGLADNKSVGFLSFRESPSVENVRESVLIVRLLAAPNFMRNRSTRIRFNWSRDVICISVKLIN